MMLLLKAQASKSNGVGLKLVLLMLQAHHLRHLSPEAFTKAFGFAPVEDSQRRIAEQMLDALIVTKEPK